MCGIFLPKPILQLTKLSLGICNTLFSKYRSITEKSVTKGGADYRITAQSANVTSLAGSPEGPNMISKKAQILHNCKRCAWINRAGLGEHPSHIPS